MTFDVGTTTAKSKQATDQAAAKAKETADVAGQKANQVRSKRCRSKVNLTDVPRRLLLVCGKGKKTSKRT